MDAGTARDMIEDLQLEREELLARIRRLESTLEHEAQRVKQLGNDYLHWRRVAEELLKQINALEAERDQWQRQAVNNG
jgi:archaellum component FlaC